MPKKLLITEKPSVAREFQKALKINGKNNNNFISNNFFNWLKKKVPQIQNNQFVYDK